MGLNIGNSSEGASSCPPGKRRGQEAAGVSHMSNRRRKRLCKQKRVCNTLSTTICRPSELLRILQNGKQSSDLVVAFPLAEKDCFSEELWIGKEIKLCATVA